MECEAFLESPLIPQSMKYDLIEEYVIRVTYSLYVYRNHTPDMYPHMVWPDGSVVVFWMGYYRALRVLIAMEKDFGRVKQNIREKIITAVAASKTY